MQSITQNGPYISPNSDLLQGAPRIPNDAINDAEVNNAIQPTLIKHQSYLHLPTNSFVKLPLRLISPSLSSFSPYLSSYSDTYIVKIHFEL